MSSGRLLRTAGSPSSVVTGARSPDASITRLRAMLLSGYGKGASAATVAAMTRDRQMVARVPCKPRGGGRGLLAIAATGVVVVALARGIRRRRSA